MSTEQTTARFDPATYPAKAMRQAYGEALLEAARRNPKVVALAADCLGQFWLSDFAKEFPKRSFNVGIAEQNLIGIAAGMASSGLVPFACGLAPFVSMRAAEQIRTDVCYPKFNVKIATMYGGVSRGIGGSTHHATEDLAILRSMANMAVVVPADATETHKAVLAALDYPGPVYLRLAAMDPDPLVYREDYDFAIGKAVALRGGDDVTIVACGQMVIFALWAAEALADEGIRARVLNVHTVKPIDREAVVKAARETGRIVTVEDHNVLGGLGSAVAEVVVAECPVPVRMLGIPDLYAAVGPTPDLWKKYGLTWENIAATARELVRQGSSL